MTPRVHCAGMGGQLTTRPKRKTGPEIEGLPRLVRLLAHDVNNPLTAVRILAEMNAEGELAADMHDILEAADLAAALLEAMDALMREDHRRTYSFFPMRLDEVLARVADRPALARIVSTDVPSDLLATGDQSALERALSDVLFNARQLAGGGPIHVRARRADAFVEVVVHHGVGRVPPPLRADLFQPGGARELREMKVPVLASGLFFARSAVAGMGGGMEFRDASDGGLELVIRLMHDGGGPPR